MPLATRWRTYRPLRPPDVVGVYELGRGNHILYVGSGIIGQRLRQHLNNKKKEFQQYRCLTTRDRRRAVTIERREILAFRDTHDRLPKYNAEIPYSVR